MRHFCLICYEVAQYRIFIFFFFIYMPYFLGFSYYYYFYGCPWYFVSSLFFNPFINVFCIFWGVFLAYLFTPVLVNFFIFLLKKMSLNNQYLVFFVLIFFRSGLNNHLRFLFFWAYFFLFFLWFVFFQIKVFVLLPDDALFYPMPLYNFNEMSICVNKFLDLFGLNWAFQDIAFFFFVYFFFSFFIGFLEFALKPFFWKFESNINNSQYEGETFYYKRASLLVERKLAIIVKKYYFFLFFYFSLLIVFLLIFYFFSFFFSLFTAYLQFNFLLIISNFLNSLCFSFTLVLVFLLILWFLFFIFLFFPFLFYFILAYRLSYRIFLRDIELAKKNKFIKT